jgi:hypothetical protein
METPAPIRTKVKWTEEHSRGSFEDMTDTYATEACEGFVIGYVSYPGSVVVYVTQGTMAEYTLVRSLDELEFDMDDPVTRFILGKKPPVVFLTYKNADMTTGDGPMIPDRCFAFRAEAVAYIDSQPGVQGRRAKWSEYKFGDWEIRELSVE